MSHFLEKQGFKKQALAVSRDPEHRFDLALALGELKIATELAHQADSEEKWKQLSQAATQKGELQLAGECLSKAHDYGGLLLLASCAGSEKLMTTLAKDSYESGQHNASFLSNLLLGNVEHCVNILVETDRIPEATFFAHTYCPSQVSRLVHLWQAKASQALSGIGKRNVGESLADPSKYENLFAGFAEALETEKQRNFAANNNGNANPSTIQQVPKDELELIKKNLHNTETCFIADPPHQPSNNDGNSSSQNTSENFKSSDSSKKVISISSSVSLDDVTTTRNTFHPATMKTEEEEEDDDEDDGKFS